MIAPAGMPETAALPAPLSARASVVFGALRGLLEEVSAWRQTLPRFDPRANPRARVRALVAARVE